MTIAVDFDGTIVKHRYPAIGREIPFAIDALKLLQEEGHKIILWTVREGATLDEAVEFCHRRGLDFYAVNSEFPNASWSGSGVSRKIRADVYIDDRNLGGLDDWESIYRELSTIASSSGHSEHSGHGHRSLLGRVVERSRAAREKFNR